MSSMLAEKYTSQNVTNVWDMIELYLSPVFHSLWELEALGRKATETGSELMDHGVLGTSLPFVNSFYDHAEKLELRVTAKQLGQLKHALGCNVSGNVLAEIVRGVRSRLAQELSMKHVYYLDTSDMKPMHSWKDWKVALDAFPSAKSDVEDAMWCYAVGRNNACVFQLMRAVEYGMRALAAERGLSLIGGKKLVEWATWSEVLAAIGAATNGVRSWKSGPAKDAALEFYNGALTDMEAMKDMYRNKVSHARSDYQRWDSDSAIFRVREFLTRLSTKIKEGTTTQLQESDWP